MSSKTEGSLALEAAGSNRQLAEQLGVSRESIRLWISGEKRPSDAHKRRLEDRLGIAIGSWDLAAVVPEATDEPSDGTSDGTSGGTIPREALEAQLTRIRAERAKPRLTEKARIDLEKLELAVLRELGKHEVPRTEQSVTEQLDAAIDDMCLRCQLKLWGKTDPQGVAELARTKHLFPAQWAAVEAALGELRDAYFQLNEQAAADNVAMRQESARTGSQPPLTPAQRRWLESDNLPECVRARVRKAAQA